MEPTKNDDHLNKENALENTDARKLHELKTAASFTSKKRNVPVSSLSASEEEDSSEDSKEQADSEDVSNKRTKSNSFEEDLKEKFSLPTLKIQPILGGKPLSFPVHPRLTLIDLRDFILFTLNIPHPQQILSFYSSEENKIVLLSNYSENTLLCRVPGLIDELTGRCAPVSLSFKISSGMDFSVHPSDVEYENNDSEMISEQSGYLELYNNDSDPISSNLSALAASIVSLVPLPPGVDKSSRMLFRSLSKSSPSNSNLPTLWEIYFPESGVKMMVTALINVNEIKEDEEPKDVEYLDKSNTSVDSESITNTLDTKIPAPALVITPPPTTSTFSTNIVDVIRNINNNSGANSTVNATIFAASESIPKIHCEKCRIKCRPALRFICKCNKTFCQSHRYPDQHDCTYDHRADAMATIQANNPKIVKDKVGNF